MFVYEVNVNMIESLMVSYFDFVDWDMAIASLGGDDKKELIRITVTTAPTAPLDSEAKKESSLSAMDTSADDGDDGDYGDDTDVDNRDKSLDMVSVSRISLLDPELNELLPHAWDPFVAPYIRAAAECIAHAVKCRIAKSYNGLVYLKPLPNELFHGTQVDLAIYAEKSSPGDLPIAYHNLIPKPSGTLDGESAVFAASQYWYHFFDQ